MSAPPTGTVTFLFTDIEGSTQRWEKFPTAMARAVERHDLLLRGVIEKHSGFVFKTVGDAFCAAFANAQAGVEAALEAQRAIAGCEWGEVAPLKVRMALHTGVAQERDNDYFGPPVNRVARILGVGHGGQTLLSQATRQMLIGAEPSEVEFQDFGHHRLKDLAQAEQIYGVLVPELEREFPPLRSLNRQAHNLPVHPTPLIGRDSEVEQVLALLRDDAVRLVTLSGPGGTGKTRLSLQIAADALDCFPKGAYFVPLAHVANRDEIVAAIRQVLGLRETAEEALLPGLIEHLRTRRCLLVLDNFEQIVASSSLLAELLSGAPGLKLLVTSQSVLRLRGECEFPVPPLAVPLKRLPPLRQLARVPAVELFVSRAQAVRSSFELTSGNAAAVAEICRRLDGLPLAIELAAARSKLLAPEAMLAHLKDRLKLLTGGARDLPARQRTLRDAITWSFELLEEEEKVLLRRLAVFRSGFTLEAALEVAELTEGAPTDVFNGLEALADRSLLQQQEESGEIRFAMLENIREFGLEQLAASGEAGAVKAQHAEFFGAWMEELAKQAKSNPSLSLENCEAEHENLRAALNWRLENDPEAAGRLAAALAPYWERQGHFREAIDSLSRALNIPCVEPTRTRAKLLELAGWFRYMRGEYEAAFGFMERCLDLCRSMGERGIAADALNDLGLIAQAQGDSTRAQESFEASLALEREVGNPLGQATRLSNLGWLAIDDLRFDDAHALLMEARAIHRELGDGVGEAACLCNLGELELRREDYAAARDYSLQGLKIFREHGDQRGIAFTLANIGEAATASDDLPSATPYLEEAVTVALETGMEWLLPQLLQNLARCYRTSAPQRAYLALVAVSRFGEAVPETLSNLQKELEEELGPRAHDLVESVSKLSHEAIIVQIVEPQPEEI